MSDNRNKAMGFLGDVTISKGGFPEKVGYGNLSVEGKIASGKITDYEKKILSLEQELQQMKQDYEFKFIKLENKIKSKSYSHSSYI